MSYPLRPIAFVFAATNHGAMIVNRNDYCTVSDTAGFGVGLQLFANSAFDEAEVNFVLSLLSSRKDAFGDGVVAVDGGANIGVHTVEWARHMTDWGSVISFEAQEYVYYALAGNIALNNCFNARAHWAALGEKVGVLEIPTVDPRVPASFGSVELRQRENTEPVGQPVSYAPEDMYTVDMYSVDSLGLDRLDFLKLDVEGMEADVLQGALETIRRLRPILLIEVIKSDKVALENLVTKLGYSVIQFGLSILAIHGSDPTLKRVKVGTSNAADAQVSA